MAYSEMLAPVMGDAVNKIRLNNKLWFTVLGNKMVFGENNDTSDCHYTISFGNRSGHFDLHLTNEKSKKHFPVFNISHQNIAEHLPLILSKVLNSVLELEQVNDEELSDLNSTVYRFADLGDVFSEFSPLIKKDKIVINKDSDDFKQIVDKLVEKSALSVIDRKELDDLPTMTGILKMRDNVELIVKNPMFGNQLLRLNKFDLDINSVVEKILGTERYTVILAKIDEGLLTLRT